MPSLGADMDSGELLEWRVKPGDTVHRGDIVAVVDTKKAEIEIEIFEDARVEELLVEPGATVPVGTPIARVASTDGAVGTEPPQTQTVRAEPAAAAIQAAPVAPPTPTPRRTPPPSPVPHRRRVSPLARRTAAELGVDVATIDGSGLRGAVVAADVERAAHPHGHPPEPPDGAPPAAPATPSPERQVAMRDSIAALMARSKREIPHYYLATEIDMAAALAFLERTNTNLPVRQRLLPAALLVKAVAVALHDFPQLNGFWSDDRFQPADGAHVGFAVALRGGGLIAPAIHDVSGLALADLMEAIHDLVRRTRAGTLRASEMSDPTITVTNLGERGVETVYGVIYPPQVAIVGFGRIAERPRAIDGMLAIRPTIVATLAADHRATDGHLGARFLAAIDEHLQHPEEL